MWGEEQTQSLKLPPLETEPRMTHPVENNSTPGNGCVWKRLWSVSGQDCVGAAEGAWRGRSGREECWGAQQQVGTHDPELGVTPW